MADFHQAKTTTSDLQSLYYNNLMLAQVRPSNPAYPTSLPITAFLRKLIPLMFKIDESVKLKGETLGSLLTWYQNMEEL